MAEFTKEQLIEQAEKDLDDRRAMAEAFPGVVRQQMKLRLAEIALAALTAGMEQEPVGWQFKSVNGHWIGLIDELGNNQAIREGCDVRPVYAAPKLPQPTLTVWYGSMPESNGAHNWTAILHRKGDHPWEGITIDRSEYHDRVRYEADRMRHLIGDLADDPDILAYDADAHSGYVKPVSQPYTLRDGWVAVPVEPTAEMISEGIAAHYERSQTQIHDRPAPGPMECAYMAMLAAAPQQEVK